MLAKAPDYCQGPMGSELTDCHDTFFSIDFNSELIAGGKT
jgi:hypothetical protein